MPMTRIEIEEIQVGKWNGEVEVGGQQARRHIVRGTSFEDVWKQVKGILGASPVEAAKPAEGTPPSVPVKPVAADERDDPPPTAQTSAPKAEAGAERRFSKPKVTA